MNTYRKLAAAVAFGATSAALSVADPAVSGVTLSQDDATRRVTIGYTLANGPAVVTVDVLTNSSDGAWTSIGGANVQGVTGDVWKKVETGARTITWHPDLSWPDNRVASGGAKVVVTAWPLDNTPDYMVVDITSGAEPGTQRYYPSVDFLPGGLLENPDYRTTSLVLRKVLAKGVTWTMGSTSSETKHSTTTNEGAHSATLTNNYYVGVFQVTQAQWALVQTNTPSSWANKSYRAMRPVEQVSYNEIRNSATRDSSKNTSEADAAYEWPASPNPLSFLGRLRTRTGLDFDLPSEAQWEYACRAGNGNGKWGDGSKITQLLSDPNMSKLGRYTYDGGQIATVTDGKTTYSQPGGSCTAENATAIVGSYLPNDWGLYDMHGNVHEWCLDWYADDISSLDGKVNIDPTTPANALSSGTAGTQRVMRGGSWNSQAEACRSSKRSGQNPRYGYYYNGVRVICTAGLR